MSVTVKRVIEYGVRFRGTSNDVLIEVDGFFAIFDLLNGGQKLNRHKFSPVSASKLPFSKESGEAAAAAARFVVESGTAQLRFHYEAELSNVVVRVDLRSAQVFELGPVESICVDEGSNGGENEKMHTDVLGKMLDSSVSVQPLVKSIQELASAAKLVEAEIKFPHSHVKSNQNAWQVLLKTTIP
ncbi:hypothetical protein Sjap_014149 [Stephania japonica]|uniref:Probable histone-arginine methyltransferase CARM1-like N-terminal PH domain-containing protein n=1 Tax=Stephania japonica TaxID=461633 RepID=A0AAP0J1A8_9MAGN